MHALIENGAVAKYPYTIGNLRRDNPNTSFPKRPSDEMLASWGMYPVGYEAAPDYDPMTHRLDHSAKPVLKDGNWVLTKTVVALTEGQIADRDAAQSKEVRSKRDNLLSESDWRVIKAQETSTPMSQAWVDYRQALRDITDHANFPWLDDADWPVKPE